MPCTFAMETSILYCTIVQLHILTMAVTIYFKILSFKSALNKILIWTWSFWSLDNEKNSLFLKLLYKLAKLSSSFDNQTYFVGKPHYNV